MPSWLCLSVTFLDPAFHGRADGGEPEWPPSPLRLFQSLVAALAARAGGEGFDEPSARALKWLEAQPAPVVVAPPVQVGVPVRIAVPNNDMDVPAAAWAKGHEPKKQPRELKTMKTVRPTHLRGPDAVHFLYPLPAPLPGEVEGHVEALCVGGRSLTRLGWGVDLVAGHGRVLGEDGPDDPRRLVGYEVWRPATPSAVGLRVPKVGTLDALVGRHRAFLERLQDRGFQPVPALTGFAVVGYRRTTDPPPRPFAAFEVFKPLRDLAALRAGQSRYRPFDPVRHTITVAGMVRHATAGAAHANGRPPDWINTFVHGHTPDGTAPASGPHADRRLAFLPLPSITPLRVESIRRVLVAASPEDASAVAWVRSALSGRELFAEHETEARAMLSMVPDSDRNLRPYVGTSDVWSTVTPVVLPGRYSKGAGRTKRLLRHAFEEAGYGPELFARAEVEWREVGFRPGVDLARRYRLPESLGQLSTCHVRVRWPVAIRGPLVIGVGRYRGLGLFAAEREGLPAE